MLAAWSKMPRASNGVMVAILIEVIYRVYSVLHVRIFAMIAS
jgi:hypothetical protein